MSVVPHLHLTDALANVYSFPPSLFLGADPAQARSTIRELLYGHGGRQVGDQFVKSRRVLVRGELQADSAAAFETAYRALVNACFKGGRLSVVSDTVQRCIDVTLLEVDGEWLHWPNYKRVDLTFDAAFPFWRDLNATTAPHVVPAGSTVFTVDLSGSDHIVMPVFEVDADQGQDVPTFLLTNITDGGMYIQIDDPAFVVGDAMVIDSSEGTIERNGNDAMDHFVAGSFLRLQPEVNTVQYDGAACTVKVIYRRLYL